MTARDRRRANQYLREYFLRQDGKRGADTARIRQKLGKKIYKRSKSTLREVAHRLNLFIRWTEATHHEEGQPLPINAIQEEDIDRFADEMEAGIWSVDGSGASDNYIRDCQAAAISYLQWLHLRGFRPPIELSEEQWIEARAGVGKNPNVTRQRRNRYLVMRRADPAEISYPTLEEATAFINSIDDLGEQIIVELMARCGLRASEVCMLLDQEVPSLKQLTRVVVVGTEKHLVARGGHLSVVGKGRKKRRVEISPDLVKKIDQYRAMVRKRSLLRFRKTHGIIDPKDPRHPAQLLLKSDGTPISYKIVWKAVRKAATRSRFTVGRNLELTPHLLRHTYAMHYLLRSWRRKCERAEKNGILLILSDAQDALSAELILLQKNLGHRSPTTTLRYLEALWQFLSVEDLASEYNLGVIDARKVGLKGRKA